MNTLCKDVSDRKTYTFTVTIREFGGKVVGEWSNTAPFEPNYAHIALFLGNEQVERHSLGKASGAHTFNRSFGAGYRLAITGHNFSGADVELVSTAVTEHSTSSLTASKTYAFSVSLSQVEGQAQLTWASDAVFRPRQSRAEVTENGNVVRDPWIEAASGNQTTDLRWGVDLAAAYTAEDYSGKRIDIARTPTTKGS